MSRAPEKIGRLFTLYMRLDLETILITVKNSILLGNTNTFEINSFSYGGVSYPRASCIPAVTHVDKSSRVQTVTMQSNKFIYSLIDEFERITGLPVIINTSLNFRGKPIVENPTDAIGSFYSSGLDFLILGNYLLEK